eukprot:m.607105 g.607105  ORF g.607105 m.607105 type:complete len:784 (+) comp22476_c1_seq2:334-2685(+)
MAEVQREISRRSMDSLEALDSIERDLLVIKQTLDKFTTLKQASTSWDCAPFANEIHGALAQVEKLQARLDNIHTSELHGAKEEVKKRRRSLTIRCESLEVDLHALEVTVEHVARIPSQVSNGLRDVQIDEVESSGDKRTLPHNSVPAFTCRTVKASSVELSWEKPRLESSGNELFVECYEIRARREGDDGEWGTVCGGDSIKGDVTSLTVPIVPSGQQVPGCTLAGVILRPGVTYRFRIRACLLHGWGPHTMLKGVTTQAPPPAAPQHIRSHSCGHNVCLVEWSAPVDADPSATFVYELQFSPSAALAGGGEWLVASSELRGTICKKLHLSPATAYSFRVRARRTTAAAAQSSTPGAWSWTLEVTTLKLEDVIEAARRKARHNHYVHHDVCPAPPLGSTPPPMFEKKQAPSVVLTIPTDDFPQGDNRRIVCNLRRQNLLEDSFVTMGTLNAREWARDMIIMFQGEDGLDYGALTRDWLKSLLEQLIHPDYGLFQQIASAGVYHPSRVGVAQTDYVVYYVLFGRALAKAFVSNTPVTVRLSTLVLKALLGQEHGALADLRHFDQDVHRSLTWMLENDVSVLEETFCTQFDSLGKRITVDLIPNGSETPVTEANKHTFVKLKARALMLSGIEQQLNSICKGFHDLVPMKSFKDFSVADLHVALSGVVEVKTHDWKRNTDVSDEFRNHPHVIQAFWEIVASMSNEQRSKLLYFATACASPPVGGFANLTPRRFNIQTEPNLPPKSLPKAHSCFCTLILPLDIADDFEEFRQKLNLAISECDGFGLL